MVRIGIEQLILSPPAQFQGKKLGLLCNQASTDSHLRHSRELIRQAFPDQLTCIFSPQHGFFAEKQDNMIESGHAIDKATGLPVFSLYGTERRPTRSMFDHLDILLVDLIDVGTRVYTFMYTLAYCLEAAAQYGKQVVVLDRPNPLGGLQIEGNILREECRSFVGLYPIPMRHGLTFGELALFMNNAHGIGADLEVIAMSGWQRRMFHRDTGLPFVFPSPNMPTPETALVYPGQVIWEGTNISEGRGTAMPFELCGAPFWEHERLIAAMGDTPLPGCFLRPIIFEPTFNKWAAEPCAGFHLHVTDPGQFLPYRTSLALLQATMTLYPDHFRYKTPPYEYEFERLPLDLILGDSAVRLALEQGADLLDLEKSWQPAIEEFAERRRDFLLYT
jgi:uncharacterized protein YbbC (DUF1343 family)